MKKYIHLYDDTETKVIDLIKAIPFVFVGLAVIILCWFYFQPLPIVYTSTSTGLCVGVYVDGVKVSCKYLDENNIKKYERVWVK